METVFFSLYLFLSPALDNHSGQVRNGSNKPPFSEVNHLFVISQHSDFVPGAATVKM